MKKEGKDSLKAMQSHWWQERSDQEIIQFLLTEELKSIIRKSVKRFEMKDMLFPLDITDLCNSLSWAITNAEV